MNKKIYVIDSQILNTASECSRKANYTFDRNLVPIITPDYFEKGTLLHQMLAEFYRLRNSWDKSYAELVEHCVNLGRLSAITTSLEIEVVEDVIRAFSQYCTHYVNDGWNQILSVESVASKILYEDDERIYLYQGQIDLSIAIKSCSLLPVDHKSSSRRGKPQHLSNQFQGYCWLLGVNNIIINKIGFQTSLKPSEKFERHMLSYSPDLIEEWREQAIYWISKYIGEQETNYFPPNYTACDKYSGCIFQAVCKQTKETRQYKLDMLFNERPKWDVGKEDT